MEMIRNGGETAVKKELKHFYIGDSYGGNQDWFLTFMMRIGGCAVETVCDLSVYFAKHYGKRNLYPYSLDPVDRKEYVRYAHQVKPYIGPRPRGVDKLETYVDGISRYFHDREEAELRVAPFSGEEPYSAAAVAVRNQIDGNYPIPCLILKHRNPLMDDYVWHWFLLNGYEINEGQMKVRAVTYSNWEWLDFATLWDTGYSEKGGLILLSGLNENERMYAGETPGEGGSSPR